MNNHNSRQAVSNAAAIGKKGGAMDESQFLEFILASVFRDGVSTDPHHVVNFYVALKSKPLVILSGPASGGKAQMVRSVARVITGGVATRFQEMSGHAWWAARSENLSAFTRMQERFISGKITALLYEACNPDHLNTPFILSINHMSPAELDSLFIDLARQLQQGELNRLLSEDFPLPLPFPPNLHAIGTIDMPIFNWFDNAALLSQATVIHWPTGEERSMPGRPSSPSPPQVDTQVFNTARFHRVSEAQAKLGKFLAWREHFQPVLIHLAGWLLKHGVQVPSRVIMDEAAIYMANAFSKQDVGLFASDTTQNLRVALDFALAQIVLPRAWKELCRSDLLREIISDQLGEEFPHARWVVEQSSSSTA